MTLTAEVQVIEIAATSCPECDAPKFTAETLRVHRWIAHGVHAFPRPEHHKG